MTLESRLKALERLRARQDAELNQAISAEMDRLDVPLEDRDELLARLRPVAAGLRTLSDHELLAYLHGGADLPWE